MDLFEDTCGAQVLCYDVSFLNQTLAIKTKGLKKGHKRV
jgi:hypothetical protein